MGEPVAEHRLRKVPSESERRELVARARAVLDANWRGSSTVPSRSLYPHQCSWDAAFIAIGRSWVEQERAQRELESMFEAQWSTGMLPHIKFDPQVPDDAYFPGPGFWQADRSPAAPRGVPTSGITQPPLHPRAALEIWRHAGDRAEALAFLGRLYPKLAAQHAHMARWRDPDGHGLAAIVHPWESGQDNSPLWDADLDHLEIPPGALPPYQRYDVRHADAADRPTDASYDRYVYLAVTFREHDYDDRALISQRLFCVEPPLFNAIYLWSELVLARAGVDQHRLAGLARAAPARRDGAGRRGRGQHGRPGPLLRLPRVLRPLRRPGLRQRRLQLDRRAAAGRAGEPRGRAVVERVTIAFTPAFRGHPRVRPHGRHPGASRGRGCWSWPPAGPDGRPTCSCWRSATRRPWPASAAQPAARLSAGGRRSPGRG